MKIAILGGAGYIGGAITAHLAYRGHEIRVIGSDRRFKDLQDALEPYQYRNNVTYCPMDFLNPDPGLWEGQDSIVFAAGPSGSVKCDTDKVPSVFGHLGAILPEDCFAALKDAHKVFLSTFHLYRGHTPPFDETMEIKQDGDLYRTLKAGGETILGNAPPTTILRLPHVYGLGLGYAVDPNGFVAKCVDHCMQGAQSMSVLRVRWQFLHLYDLVRFVEYAIDKKAQGCFNVGNPQPAYLYDVLALTARIADVPVPKMTEMSGYGDMWMDVSRGRSALGWGQSILMEQGIREMIVNYDRWKK